MECIESFFLSGVEGPRLTAVQECGRDTITKYCHLSVGGELVVVPHFRRRSHKGVGAQLIRLLISALRERLSMMVDPRFVT